MKKLIENIRAYVRDGGRLFCDLRCGAYDEHHLLRDQDAGLSDGEFLAEAEALAGDFSQPRRTGRGGKLAWLLSLTLFLLLAASWILYFTVL